MTIFWYKFRLNISTLIEQLYFCRIVRTGNKSSSKSIMFVRVTVYSAIILLIFSACTTQRQSSSGQNSSNSRSTVVNKDPKFLDDISIAPGSTDGSVYTDDEKKESKKKSKSTYMANGDSYKLSCIPLVAVICQPVASRCRLSGPVCWLDSSCCCLSPVASCCRLSAGHQLLSSISGQQLLSSIGQLPVAVVHLVTSIGWSPVAVVCRRLPVAVIRRWMTAAVVCQRGHQLLSSIGGHQLLSSVDGWQLLLSIG